MYESYLSYIGAEMPQVKKLSGAGSNRQYYRLSFEGAPSLIGVYNENVRENTAFFSLARHMKKQGLRVPEVYCISADRKRYLQEDLGDTSLYDIVQKTKKSGDEWNAEVVGLFRQVMRDLPKIQVLTAKDLDTSIFLREKEFSPNTIRWDLNYFKYCFLKPAGLEIDEVRLEEEFAKIASDLMWCSRSMPNLSSAFLYRDFQSRNIMVKDGKPYYIDFQGGFLGPVFYDVACLLWQSRIKMPQELRRTLCADYHKAMLKFHREELRQVRRAITLFAFFRVLQTLGAYGFRGLFEKKTMFITPIADTLAIAREFFEPKKLVDYPYISSLLEEASRLPQFLPQPAEGPLTVRITSFSFKKGIPDDYSGNGGGFVFDCRAPHNPGRYPEYKQLNGLDQPVIDFLEAEPSMPEFMKNVYGLVDPAVETYISRGFTSLMVSFGCTGGQHRSVYAAQHLADHLAAKFPQAKITLQHREQGISREYN